MPILFSSGAVELPSPGADPVIRFLSSQTAQVGEESSLVFEGETEDDTYSWEMVGGPSGAVMSGEDTATFTITWTPASEGAVLFTVSLTDEDDRQTVEAFEIRVISLVVPMVAVAEVENPTGSYDLNEGAADWLAFAHTTAGQVTQKDGVDLITNFALVGDPTASRNLGAGVVPTLEWTDGDDPATATGVIAATSRWASGLNSGVTFKLQPSATDVRAARLFLRLRAKADGESASVSISGVYGSGTPSEIVLETSSATPSNHYVEILYRHPDATPLDVSVRHQGASGAFFIRAIQVLGGTAPAIEVNPSVWSVGQGAAFTASVELTGLSDTTGIELSSPGLPSWARFDANGAQGTFTCSPPAGALDAYLIDLVALREEEVVARLLQTLTVTGVVPPPVLTAADTWTLTVGVASTLAASATGTGTIALRASGLRGRAVFVCPPGSGSASGTAYWTPQAADVGTSTLTFTATDSAGRTSTHTVAVTVNAA